jgi:peptidoglycan/LPS O-acetylase OafA/YrhL
MQEIKNKAIHLRGLNGLRAIAAIAVVISHISLALPEFGLIPIFADSKGNPLGIYMASYGVTIFFALSGFLITFLLLKEKEKQEIHIKHFYIRRILRIWPLYYLYLLICLAVYFIFDISFNYLCIPFYVFLAANFAMIANAMLPLVAHFWSIGVEEWFYLFWPWVAKVNNRELLKISFLFVVLFYLLKVIFYYLQSKYPVFSIGVIAMGVNRFHIMIIGCIGAILYYNNSKWITYFTSLTTQFLCWFILFLAALNIFHVSSALIDHEVIGIVTVLIIFSQITRVNMVIDLDKKIFIFIGKISFGIYVIHPLLIFLLMKSIGTFKDSSIVNYFTVYSLVIILTIALPYISYNFYEKKFILFKDRFAKIKSRA